MTARPKKGRGRRGPSTAVFEDILEQFIDSVHPLMLRISRSKNRSVSEFCCVIGPGGEDDNGQKFTMNAYDRNTILEKVRGLDDAAAISIEAPIQKDTVRIVIFFKGVIFVKDVYFMPAQNSRGGKA